MWMLNFRSLSLDLHSSKKESSSVSPKRSKSQIGASMVEYALLVALIALIAIPAVKGLGKGVEKNFLDAKTELAGVGAIECAPGNPEWPGCLP